MKNIFDVYNECNATPANTVGMGNPMLPTAEEPGTEPLHPHADSADAKPKKKKKKTLHESILADMEDQIAVGDKFNKQYKKMLNELDNMKTICSSTANWIHKTYRFDPQNYPNAFHQGISERYYNIVDCPHIFKNYGLTYKSLIIKLDFTPGLKGWVVEFCATRQTSKNWDVDKRVKQEIIYRFIDKRYVPGPGNGPTTSADKLLHDHVLPFMTDIDTLYENIIETFVTGIAQTTFKDVKEI